jgi:predicted permease
VIALALIPADYPAWATTILSRLGGTLAPLALVSVGLQLRLAALPGNRGALALGLSFKLVLAPLRTALLYGGAPDLRAPSTQITIFEAAMAPQVGGSVVAIQHGLNPRLISLMVGVGTVLSFVPLPLWWRLFAGL